jgi:pyruvate/2-oxoglutarate dehydrogenase complex dihydrolipoamide dehydrogenase (E3) component
MINCKYLIIGGGESGLFLAKEIAQLGHKVVLAEQDSFGGSYIFNKEIPKFWLKSEARKFQSALEIFKIYPVTHKTLLTHREKIPEIINKKINSTYNYFLQDYETIPNLILLNTQAKFYSKTLIEINTNNEKDFIKFEQCIIAIGKNSLERPKFISSKIKNYLHQYNFFQLRNNLARIIIIGFTSKNLEIANICVNLGIKTIIYEKKSQKEIFAYYEPYAIEYLSNVLKKRKIDVFFESEIIAVQENNNEIEVQTNNNLSDSATHIYAEAKEKFSDNVVELAKTGIAFDFNGIVTDNRGRTNIENIWALGECNSKFNDSNKHNKLNDFVKKVKVNGERNGLWSNVASYRDDSNLISEISCHTHIQTDKPIVIFGITESRAKQMYHPDITSETIQKIELDGFCKIVYRKSNGQIVGVTLTGEMAQFKHYISLALGKNISAIEVIKYIQGVG